MWARRIAKKTESFQFVSGSLVWWLAAGDTPKQTFRAHVGRRRERVRCDPAALVHDFVYPLIGQTDGLSEPAWSGVFGLGVVPFQVRLPHRLVGPDNIGFWNSRETRQSAVKP